MSERVWVLRVNFSKKIIDYSHQKWRMEKKQRRDCRRREIGTYITHEKLEEVQKELYEVGIFG